MDEKTKLYVFAKKEVALIFVFMILIAITSFVFGVKVGKGYSYQVSGLAPEDKQKIDLMSEKEEEVNKILEEKKGGESEAPGMSHETTQGEETGHGAAAVAPEKIEKKDAVADTHKRLEEELKKLDDQKQAAAGKEVKEETPFTPKTEVKAQAPKKEVKAPKKDQYSGKFTIQLGSHKTMAEAEKFADGFRIRGYDPIINEVEVRGQAWYRVSLGVFTSVSEAKDYIIKEKSLFQGQDYVIGRFD